MMENPRAERSRRSRSVNDECRQVLMSLPDDLLKERGDQSSSKLYQHLSQCRGCFEAYLSLQAAADLACPLLDQ